MILPVLCAGSILASCDFLAFDESTGKTHDEVYSTFENQKSVVADVYSYLPQDFGVMDNALREAATDNAVYVWNTSSVYKI